MNPRKLLSMLAVMALACGGLMYSQHLAHADDPGRSIPAVDGLTSTTPGEITVTLERAFRSRHSDGLSSDLWIVR